MSTIVWIIFAAAVMTFLTRVGGHLVLSRFERIHYRVEAGLNAVPAAVLTTLVAPPAFTNSWQEFAALLFSGLIATRFSMMPMFFSGAAFIILLRHFFPI
ncbi:branched-chain amino acid transport [Paramesorhizobium deserti]|uniref:Branched-chain amino acid transport n=1 Tax=Paramesorhizobium deserti TaxID=1494590 RepID=A0A135HUG0_9HYPH|nr:AzlD family protein [Paramesorhizobium deserti]KXF76832.1 branched-chain amino acid transport [Paramesorhizobium deserti]